MMTRSKGSAAYSRAVAALVVTTMAVGGALSGSSGTAVAAPSVNCAKYMAYLLPGTTETSQSASATKDSGMLGNVGEKLKAEFGDDIGVEYVPYSASAFDKGLTYKASQQTGVTAAAQMIAKCPNSEIVLAGYSQGADAMGDVAWHIGKENAPIKSDQVRGVALLADPKRGDQPVVGGQETEGQGISGGRDGGYGSLANRIKWLCADKDMYCNTTSKNPFAKVFGKLLGSSSAPNGVAPLGNVTTTATKDDPTSDLTSDFSNVDLVGAKSKATDLKTRTEALANSKTTPTKDQVDEIGSLAKSLNSTYSAVDNVSKFAKNTGAGETLAKQNDGTPENQTSKVLDVAGKTDLSSLVSSTESVANTAGSLSKSMSSGDTSGTLTQGGEMFKDLALKGAGIASSSNALNSVDRSNLTAATSVLSTLKVSTVVDTGIMALTVGASTDYQGIFDDIVTMGQQITVAAQSGGNIKDVKAVYTTSQGLLNKIEPWVDLANSANAKVMPMAASMVGAVPDPYGYAQIASLVMSLMSQVDIKAIWNTARSAYDIAGQVIDGKPEALVGMLPLGLNLATIGVSALTGTDTGLGGSRSSQANTTGGSDTTSGANGQALTSLVGKLGGTQDFTQLASDGMDFMSFLNSGAHTSAYTNKKMVGNMSAVDYMAEYFIAQLRGDEDSSGSSNSPSESNSPNSSEPSSPSSSENDGDRGDRDGEPSRKPMFEGNEEPSSSSVPSSSSSRPAAWMPRGNEPFVRFGVDRVNGDSGTLMGVAA